MIVLVMRGPYDASKNDAKITFSTMQGLGFHLSTCQYYKEDMEQDQYSNLCKIGLPNVLITYASRRLVNVRNRQIVATLELKAMENVIEENINARKDSEHDRRMRNHGSSNRTTYNSDHK